MAETMQLGAVSIYAGGLPPGRVLDCLIAEKVFGYQHHIWRELDLHGSTKTLYCLNCQRTKGIYQKDEEDCYCGHPAGIPEYSTDIDQALGVIEKLEQSVTLSRNLWANGVWHWHCHIGGSIDDANESSIEAESVAHAICLSALLHKLDQGYNR